MVCTVIEGTELELKHTIILYAFIFLFFIETRKQYKVRELAGIRYPTSYIFCRSNFATISSSWALVWDRCSAELLPSPNKGSVVSWGEENPTWFFCFSSCGWWFCARGLKEQPSSPAHRQWEAYDWHQQPVKAVLMLLSGSHRTTSSFLSSACCYVLCSFLHISYMIWSRICWTCYSLPYLQACR